MDKGPKKIKSVEKKSGTSNVAFLGLFFCPLPAFGYLEGTLNFKVNILLTCIE